MGWSGHVERRGTGKLGNLEGTRRLGVDSIDVAQDGDK